MTALSSAIGEALNPLSADPLLVWNYGVFGVIALFASVAFWFCFKDLDADERRLNELGEGLEREGEEMEGAERVGGRKEKDEEQ